MKHNLFNPGTILLLVSLVNLISAPSRAAEDWPEFRGPTGQGLSNAKNVPVHWSATSNVVWKTAIPGEGWSSPVLVNGKIYLTTAESSNNTSLRALCVNANDGRIQWNVEVLQPDPDATEAIHQKNSLASPTPIVHDGHSRPVDVFQRRAEYPFASRGGR